MVRCYPYGEDKMPYAYIYWIGYPRNQYTTVKSVHAIATGTGKAVVLKPGQDVPEFGLKATMVVTRITWQNDRLSEKHSFIQLVTVTNLLLLSYSKT